MLKLGDKVIKKNVPLSKMGTMHTVTSEPYKVNGIDVVRLDDSTGGYAVDGLAVVERISP